MTREETLKAAKLLAHIDKMQSYIAASIEAAASHSHGDERDLAAEVYSVVRKHLERRISETKAELASLGVEV